MDRKRGMFFAILIFVFTTCQSIWAGTLAEMSKRVYAVPGIQQISLKEGEVFYSRVAKDPNTLAFTVALGKINQAKQKEELVALEFGANQYREIRTSPLALVPDSEIVIFGANFLLPDTTWQNGLFVYADGILELVFQSNQPTQQRYLNWISDPAYDNYANRICFSIGGFLHFLDFDKLDPLKNLSSSIAIRYDTGDTEIKKAPVLDDEYVVFFSTTGNAHLVEKRTSPIFWRLPISFNGIGGATITKGNRYPELLFSTNTKTQLISYDYETLRQNWPSPIFNETCSVPPYEKWLASRAGKLYQFGTDGKLLNQYPTKDTRLGMILWLTGYNQTRDLLFLETGADSRNCRLWLYDDGSGLAKYRLVDSETSKYVSNPATDDKLIAVPIENGLVVFEPAEKKVNLAPIYQLLLPN